MTDAIHTKLTESRRVAIPAEICQALGLRPGDPLVLEVANHAIVLRSLDDVVREVQAYFADAAPPDVIVSEELSRDRRAEAARKKP
jgi:AbrB family looped-hinge helix DNA binding protein